MKSIILIIVINIWITLCQDPPPPPPGGKGPPPPISDVLCATDGSNGTYREELVWINGTLVRELTSLGCPNHPSYLIAPNPNQPRADLRTRQVPAYPCLSDMPPFNLSCKPGSVGWTINGVAIYSLYAGPRYPCDATNDAAVLEGATIDNCSGHADPPGFYHYHMAPSCLLNQVNDYDDPECHSPLIGWALDGFPIYGPHGLKGDEMYSCDDDRADSKDCLDECNGHGQHTIDGFKYHYHVNGPVGDLVSSPLSPLPTTDRRPYTILCLKGVPFDWDQGPPSFAGETGYGAVPANFRDAQCIPDSGTTDDYVPQATEGLPLYTGESLDDYAKKGSKGCKARKKTIDKLCDDDKSKSKSKSKSDSKSSSKSSSKSKSKSKSKSDSKDDDDDSGKGYDAQQVEGPMNDYSKWENDYGKWGGKGNNNGGEWLEELNPSKHIDKTGYIMIGVFMTTVIFINIIVCCCCIFKEKKKGYSKSKVIHDDDQTDDEGINQIEIEALNDQ